MENLQNTNPRKRGNEDQEQQEKSNQRSRTSSSDEVTNRQAAYKEFKGWLNTVHATAVPHADFAKQVIPVS